MPPKMYLFLIRHGESTNNVLARLRLDYDDYLSRRVPDPDLTETGRKQAELVARHLAGSGHPENGSNELATSGSLGYGIQRLYVSAMYRALLTAQPIATALNLPAEVHVGIHEHGGMFHGHPRTDDVVSFPGLTRAEMTEQFPGYVLPDGVSDQGWYSGGYETMDACDVRAQGVADELKARAAEADGETIAMVSHGTFVDRLLKALLDTPGNNSFYFYHYNTAISRIDFLDDDRRVLRYTNRTLHLEPEAVTR